MAFTRYASFDSAQVLSVKGSRERIPNASFSKVATFEDFRTEDGYLYARIRAISSRVNKNHDGWPAVELAGGNDVFEQHRFASEGKGFTVQAKVGAKYGFATFLGKPIFIDHNNSDPKRTRGAIVDSLLHVEDQKVSSLDPYYASDDCDPEHKPGTWVELLLEVDAKAFPKFAKALIDGSKDSSTGIDGFSMGCNVERSVCNICKNSATTPDQFCSHIRQKGRNFQTKGPDGNWRTSKSYENCYGIGFFEISGVFDPADETALTREVRTASALPLPQAGNPGLTPGIEVPQGGATEARCPSCSGLGGSCPGCQGTGSLTVGPGGDGAVSPGGPEGQFKPGNGLLPSNMNLTPTADQFGVTPNDPRWSNTPSQFVDKLEDSGVDPRANDPYAPEERDILDLAATIEEKGISHDTAVEMAELQIRKQNPGPEGVGGEGSAPDFKVKDAQPLPKGFPSLVPNGVGTQRIHEPNWDIGPQGGPNQLNPDRPSWTRNDHRWSTTHVADNPVPQSEMTMAPGYVDTLREEKVCPVCGESLEDGSCDLCGYIEPPDGMNNPDLDRAKEVREMPQESGPDGAARRVIPPAGAPMAPPPTNNPRPLAHVKSDMQWTVVPHPRLAGRINPVERPINPGNPISTNEPNETVVKDEMAPVTSHVRTAGDILASVGRDKENIMERVAESADATAAPDVRTDVTGVGGITDASNEQASKADAQVDVAATGGTGVENVDADGHASVEQTSDNGGYQPGGEVGPPTTTWSGTDGNGVTKQVSPVGGDVFPASDEGVKKSHDDGAYPAEDGGISGGGAVKGVKPIAENFGERVDVLDHTTSPANNSGPTKTWSGTDGNGVTKQQDPTTSEVASPWTSHVISAVRLAELEISMGLLPAAEKWSRVTALGEQTEERVSTELAYAERVRTAGLKRSHKTANTEGEVVRTAKKLPVLGRPSDMTRSTSVVVPEDDELGGTLFGL